MSEPLARSLFGGVLFSVWQAGASREFSRAVSTLLRELDAIGSALRSGQHVSFGSLQQRLETMRTAGAYPLRRLRGSLEQHLASVVGASRAHGVLHPADGQAPLVTTGAGLRGAAGGHGDPAGGGLEELSSTSLPISEASSAAWSAASAPRVVVPGAQWEQGGSRAGSQQRPRGGIQVGEGRWRFCGGGEGCGGG